MKHEFMLASIPDEQENVQESEWVSYMQELRLDCYNLILRCRNRQCVRTRILVTGCRFIPTQYSSSVYFAIPIVA